MTKLATFDIALNEFSLQSFVRQQIIEIKEAFCIVQLRHIDIEAHMQGINDDSVKLIFLINLNVSEYANIHEQS